MREPGGNWARKMCRRKLLGLKEKEDIFGFEKKEK